MARALNKITSTATKKKPKKRAISLATLKLGDEPDFLSTPTKVEFIRALNWYSACAEKPDVHKDWVEEYLMKNNWKKEDINFITSKIRTLVPTYIFIARMMNREEPIEPRYHKEALAYFANVLEKHNEDEFDEEGNPIIKITPRRIRTNVSPLVEFIEEQIEGIMYRNEKPESVYAKLQSLGCNAATASQLRNIFATATAEFSELGGTNPDGELLEGYSHVRRPTAVALAKFVKQLNEDLSAFSKVVKATRKPRKKKAVKVEKLVAKVRYKKQDDTYKIASLDPARVIGSSWLWTFNTKYRILAWYEAEAGGLQIKGTSLTNFKASGQKKLRKPEQQLANFTTGAVKALPKNFEAIKTTQVEAAGRLNPDTILLRVF